MGGRLCWIALLLVAGCGGSSFSAAPADGGAVEDSTAPDSTTSDAEAKDAASGDAEPGDGGPSAPDSSITADAAADAVADVSSPGDADSAADSPADSAGDSPDDGPDAEACAAIVYYLDGDGDHYGGTTTATGCTPPASGTWVTVGGDCDDSNASVNPGQTGYFASGYVPTGQSSVSFDYDCDGKETESGNPAKANCQDVSLTCVGAGYVPAT
ncbi:MAG TPA: hypothetical protein VHS09_00465, partial [Polyangiaceae bacterium]|nr:hypothetical protein [Polyangiaceae bacterium]